MKNKADKYIRYPLYGARPSWIEAWMLKFNFGGVAKCTVCGSITLIINIQENLRESCNCFRCGSCNRQRQLAYVTCYGRGSSWGKRVSSLRDLARLGDPVVYNAEASGPIHDQLWKMKNYICSEYFGTSYKSGEMVNGVMHQDLMDLSLSDESVSLVLSSDVFEHIADPYKAHEEVYRILRKGGRHVFTVPFYQENYLDEERARVDSEGKNVLAEEPQYHDDPMRAEGALVYRVFSIEMLIKLRKIGFRTNLYQLHTISCGIFGSNGVVFEAIKAD